MPARTCSAPIDRSSRTCVAPGLVSCSLASTDSVDVSADVFDSRREEVVIPLEPSSTTLLYSIAGENVVQYSDETYVIPAGYTCIFNEGSKKPLLDSAWNPCTYASTDRSAMLLLLLLLFVLLLLFRFHAIITSEFEHWQLHYSLQLLQRCMVVFSLSSARRYTPHQLACSPFVLHSHTRTHADQLTIDPCTVHDRIRFSPPRTSCTSPDADTVIDLAVCL